MVRDDLMSVFGVAILPVNEDQEQTDCNSVWPLDTNLLFLNVKCQFATARALSDFANPPSNVSTNGQTVL